MKPIWNTEEISQYWSLNYEEVEFLKKKPYKNHIAIAVQLKYYKYFGYFPQKPEKVAKLALLYIVEQLAITIKTYHNYDWNSRLARHHRQEILDFLGIRKFVENDKREICQTIFSKGFSAPDSLEYVHEWLHKNKIDRPAEKELIRDLNSAYSHFEKSLFESISNELSSDSKAIIDCCLEDKTESMNFALLKSDPGRISLDSVLKEIEKLEFINQLELPEQELTSLNTKIMNRIRFRAFSETAWELKRHPVHIRYVLMSVFLYIRRSEIIDGLVELLVQIIHRLSVKAERKVTKTLMQDFRKVYGKDILLMRIAEAALNNPDNTVKEVVYPVAGVQILNNQVKEYKSSGKNYQKEVHKIICSSYSSHYRRMVPKLLGCMKFCSNNTMHRPVLDALIWLETYKNSNQQYYYLSDNLPIDGIVRPKYYEITIEIDDNGGRKINRINYEICVLQVLREKLRCKEIWVQGADKYRNPDEDLPQDFNINRAFYYKDLGITQDAREFIDNTKERMCKALHSLNKSIPGNKQVRLLVNNKNHISLSPLTEQTEPMNINRLKGQIQAT